MRQCILQYVLLLLFYPWVMPDTRMYESLSSIFFVYSPPTDEREKSGTRPRDEKKDIPAKPPAE